MQATSLNPQVVDGAVIAFLLQHGVSAKPPEGMRGDSVMTGLLVGMNEDALAAGAATSSAVKKAAALQEWTSWKQWALSHDDWPTFRDEWIAEYQRRQEELRLERKRKGEAFDAYWRSAEGKKTACAIAGGIGFLIAAFAFMTSTQGSLERRVIEQRQAVTQQGG